MIEIVLERLDHLSELTYSLKPMEMDKDHLFGTSCFFHGDPYETMPSSLAHDHFKEWSASIVAVL